MPGAAMGCLGERRVCSRDVRAAASLQRRCASPDTPLPMGSLAGSRGGRQRRRAARSLLQVVMAGREAAEREVAFHMDSDEEERVEEEQMDSEDEEVRTARRPPGRCPPAPWVAGRAWRRPPMRRARADGAAPTCALQMPSRALHLLASALPACSP